MITKAYVCSQSLDNYSPDPIYDISTSLRQVEDQQERQNVTKILDNVTSHDDKMYLDLKNIVVYHWKDNLVIELSVDDLDSAGRISEISVYIGGKDNLSKEDWNDLRTKILEFSQVNNRKIKESALIDFMAIENTINQRPKNKVKLIAGLLVFAVIFLAILIINFHGEN